MEKFSFWLEKTATYKASGINTVYIADLNICLDLG